MSDDKINMNHGAGGEVMANLIASTVLDNITKKRLMVVSVQMRWMMERLFLLMVIMKLS